MLLNTTSHKDTLHADTGLMILMIWMSTTSGHRLIDKTMGRPQVISRALRTLLAPMIFILSIAVIVFRNDYAISIWLLLIILEVAALVY